MAALIDLCNQSLATIKKGSIASLDEGSIEARECRRFAEPLLREMIDWSDCFPFARKRTALAEVANDRPAEWLHAYAAPSDMASPLMIRRVERPVEYLPSTGPFTFPMQDETPLAFGFEGSRIFTNVENATLIYTRSEITADELPPLGQRAFVIELAARLAMPVAKDDTLAGQLAEQAEVLKQRWIADEENRAPRQVPRYVSEVEYARMGIGL